MELSLSFYYIFIYKYFFKVSSNKCFTSEIGYIFGQILFNPAYICSPSSKKNFVPASFKF